MFKDKLPKRLKSIFSPGRDFSSQLKASFLASFESKYGPKLYGQPRFAWVGRVVLMVAIMFAATSGVSVYADTQNVPPTHPLYFMKRYSEFWQDFLTPTGNQPGLHLKFATRRLSEVEELMAGPTGGQSNTEEAAALTEDLHQEMKASLMAASSTKEAGRKASFCRALSNFVSGSSPVVEGVMMSHPKMIDHYEDQCGQFLND